MKPIRAGIRIAVAVAAALLLLGLVLLARTLATEQTAERRAAPVDLPRVGLDAVGRLAGAIRIPTVSREGEPPPTADLEILHRYLEESFPRVHETLDRQTVGQGSLLFAWEPPEVPVGSAPGSRPLLLLGHLDTVPVTPGTAERWSHPPFSGAIAQGAVWGRGTLDDKAAVLAALEAVERLLGDGFVPGRPVLLAFGHDEEVGGERGAARIAAHLARRRVEPFLVLDEGQAVIDGLMPGVDRPVAMIGIAEKGYLSVELTARGPEGHSSTPPPETAVDILARGLVRLREDSLPTGIDGPARALLEAVAPTMPLGRRVVMANLWLFEPLVARRMAAEPGPGAMLRTTMAPTMLEGSAKDNVLPAEARAVVNFRIHPRDDVAAVLAHVERAVDDDRIEVAARGGFGSEPSPLSPRTGPAWELLAGTVGEVVPESVVAPSLVVAATDARHYDELTPHVYRFLPFSIRPGDLGRIHGTDERILLEDYERMVQFYVRLIRNASA